MVRMGGLTHARGPEDGVLVGLGVTVNVGDGVCVGGVPVTVGDGVSDWVGVGVGVMVGVRVGVCGQV
jgi:hypothetical protein